MEKQMKLIKNRYSSLNKAVGRYLKNGGAGNVENCLDKNHGKTAIKRKITLLRQELLNLERMLDNG